MTNEPVDKELKKYCIIYEYKITDETTILAENEKEAKKKFKEVLPTKQIETIWEVY